MKRTIRLASLACVGAAALVALSPAAHAQSTGGTVTHASDVGTGGSFTTGFSDSNLSRPTFTETLTFTTSTTGTVSIEVSTISTGATNDTDFSNVFLSGTGLSGNIALTPSAGSTDSSERRELTNLALGVGSFTLTIQGSPGTENGSFGGTVAFQGTPAVPEPGTWAMMLLGFGGMGVAMRRRRRTANPLLSAV